MIHSLLLTKMNAPPLRSTYVRRARLTARFRHALDHAVTLVAAPAGYGKTTATRAWVETLGDAAVAWLSLDRGDNQAVVFFSYLVAAIRIARPEVGATVAAILESAQTPSVESLLAHLINELAALGGAGPLVLILDDYHLIVEEAVHRATAFLVDHLPPDAHVILISRREPPLPLARWRGRGELFQVDEADLRLTEEESAAFLCGALDGDPTSAGMAQAAAQSEGWVAGLQMVALALRGGRGTLDDVVGLLSGRHRHVADYFMSEVLALRPKVERDWLLRTSICARFCASLGAALAGSGEVAASRAILERLDRDNLFLVPLDQERHWYRYHHLFGEFLRHQLATRSPDLVAPSHARASAWFEAQGLTDEAIEHALAGGDTDAAAEWIARVAPNLIQQSAHRRLRHWFERLPAQALRRRPLLCLIHAWTLVAAQRYAGVEALLRRAESGSARGDTGDPGQARRVAAYAAGLRVIMGYWKSEQNWEAKIEAARAGLQALESDRMAALILSRLDLVVATWFLSVGDLDQAEALADDAVRARRRAGDGADIGRTLWLSALLAGLRAQLHRSVSLAQSGLAASRQWAERHGLPPAAIVADSVLHNGLAHCYYQWNRLDEAHEHAELAVEQCELEDMPVTDKRWRYAQRAQIDLAEGRYERVFEALAWMESDIADPSAEILALSEIEMINLHVGLQRAGVLSDVSRLARWLTESRHALLSGRYRARTTEAHTRARVLLALARPEEALAVLDPLWPDVLARGFCEGAMDMLAIVAAARHELGQHEQARAAAVRALSLGYPEGYVRVFVDQGEPMRQTLSGVLAQMRAGASSPAPDVPMAYLETLLLAFPAREMAVGTRDAGQRSSPRPAPKPRPLVEPLTPRECDVLRCMAAGLSHREIARELVVTLNTVRFHARNLYAKLAVNSRLQAVARARDLGLIE